MRYIKYLFFGTLFGIILYKSEVVSWFRIQEMFRFQSFHMYGVIGSAVLTGALGVWIIKKMKLKTLDGDNVEIPAKKMNKGTIIGGLVFGVGWVLTGACPGPLYTLVGAGYWSYALTLLSAALGVWVYGFFREKLPH